MRVVGTRGVAVSVGVGDEGVCGSFLYKSQIMFGQAPRFIAFKGDPRDSTLN